MKILITIQIFEAINLASFLFIITGADDGNRTHVSTLGRSHTTIVLRPRGLLGNRFPILTKNPARENRV